MARSVTARFLTTARVAPRLRGEDKFGDLADRHDVVALLAHGNTIPEPDRRPRDLTSGTRSGRIRSVRYARTQRTRTNPGAAPGHLAPRRRQSAHFAQFDFLWSAGDPFQFETVFR